MFDDLKYPRSANHGFSLLEVVLSLGIFAILVTAVTGLALSSFAFFSYSQSYDRADELANEAVAAVRSISASTFDKLIDGRVAISTSTGQWAFAGETEQIGLFTRFINILPAYRDSAGQLVASTSVGAVSDPFAKWAEIKIVWLSDRGAEQALDKAILLTDWRKAGRLTHSTSTDALADNSLDYWIQNDWQGGAGQIFDIDMTKYGLAENIDATSAPALSLAQADGTYAASGYLISSAFYATSSNFINLSWQASSSCPNCSVKVWLSVAPGEGDNFSEIFSGWLGPNGLDDGEYYATSTGTSINLGEANAGNRWIRYKVQLEGDGTATPILNSISISFKKP